MNEGQKVTRFGQPRTMRSLGERWTNSARHGREPEALPARDG